MPSLNAVLWSALGDGPWTPPVLPGSPGSLPARTDHLIVGAGIAGLSAALALAERGANVVVIDRAFGSGAACRSGGIVLGETLAGPDPAFEGCAEDLIEWIDGRKTACDLRCTTCSEIVRDDRATRPITWRDHGALGITRVVDAALIDPAALVSALASAAIEAGAVIVDHAEVEGYEHVGAGVCVQTRGGAIEATRVVFATDASARSAPFDPWPRRQFTIVLETEAFTAEQDSASAWTAGRPFYTNDLPLFWGRPLPGGRFLFGRELIDAPANMGDLSREIAGATDRMAARVRALAPAFRSIGIRRAWAGPIARDESSVPSVQEDPNVSGVWWIGGYGGHGLAQAFRLGRLAAGTVETTR